MGAFDGFGFYYISNGMGAVSGHEMVENLPDDDPANDGSEEKYIFRCGLKEIANCFACCAEPKPLDSADHMAEKNRGAGNGYADKQSDSPEEKIFVFRKGGDMWRGAIIIQLVIERF